MRCTCNSVAEGAGGNDQDYSQSIHQTTDRGYVLTGWTKSDNNGDVGDNHGSFDLWVVKLMGTSTGIGVVRSGQWILDYSMDGTMNRRINFGLATDIPVVRKWAESFFFMP